MRKPMSRNTGKKQKKGKSETQDETIAILQDISATLDAILKLLEEELEEDEPEPEPKQQPQLQANPQATGSV